MVYYSDVDELMIEIGHKHIQNEWRLFIESSKTSLKAVLSCSLLLVVYGAHFKVTYDELKYILDIIKYNIQYK